MKRLESIFVRAVLEKPRNGLDLGDLSANHLAAAGFVLFLGAVVAVHLLGYLAVTILGKFNFGSYYELSWFRSLHLGHLLLSGFISGLIFQRWSRSSRTRSTAITFSKKMTCNESETGERFSFRVVDIGHHSLGGISISVQVVRDGVFSEVEDLQISGHCQLLFPGEVSFIMGSRPVCLVCGKDFKTADLLNLHADSHAHFQNGPQPDNAAWEILITVSGMDSVSNKGVVQYHSYNAGDLARGQFFAGNCFSRDPSGRLILDLDNFDELTS